MVRRFGFFPDQLSDFVSVHHREEIDGHPCDGDTPLRGDWRAWCHDLRIARFNGGRIAQHIRQQSSQLVPLVWPQRWRFGHDTTHVLVNRRRIGFRHGPNCTVESDKRYRCIRRSGPYRCIERHLRKVNCIPANLFHHLLKTFWTAWRDEQYPDGTVVWTSPTGHTYTTRPGSRLLFPSLCVPTGQLRSAARQPVTPGRGLQMPTRRRTREQDRLHRIDAERALNAARPQRPCAVTAAARPQRTSTPLPDAGNPTG